MAGLWAWMRRHRMSNGGQKKRAAYYSAEDDEHRRDCPEDYASLPSRLLFTWVTDLIKLGNRKTLDISDIWGLCKGDDAETITTKLEHNWAEEEEKARGPSVKRAIFKTAKNMFLRAGVIKILNDVCQFANPILVQRLIIILQAKKPNVSIGMIYASLFLLSYSLQTISIHLYFHTLIRASAWVRAGMVSLVYKKATRISTTSKQGTSTGEIVNLQSNDVEKLREVVLYLNVLWDGPLQILIALIMLVSVVGPWPALAGLAVMLMLIPAQVYVTGWLTSVREKLIGYTDKRVKLITEIIQGIKAVKLFAGEGPFIHRVNEVRSQEMSEIRKAVFIEIINSFFFALGPTLVSLVSFSVFTMLGNQISAAVAFPALSLFNLIRFPLAAIPYQINTIIQANVSAARLEKFLGLAEIIPVEPSLHSQCGSIVINDADFTWSPVDDTKPPSPTLSGINLQVNSGSLIVIIGEVGAGKSTLLAAMLGEVGKVKGSVSVSGTVAYTAQDPWIQNATFQENVLMGKPLDEEKYLRVIDACALAEDLKMLRGGDQSEIGEKGINLSGGQKHRVALARAIYADADIYLLDDPLSAVDTHVGRHLFDKCICGVISQKTRVLVTHQLQFVASADTIIIMQHGKIADIGTHAELQHRGVNFSMFEGSGDGDPTHLSIETSDDQTTDMLVLPGDVTDLNPPELLLHQKFSESSLSSLDPYDEELVSTNGTNKVSDLILDMEDDVSNVQGSENLHTSGPGGAGFSGASSKIVIRSNVMDVRDVRDDRDGSDGEGEERGEGLTAPLLRGKEGSTGRPTPSGKRNVDEANRHGEWDVIDKEKQRVKGILVKDEHRSEGKVDRGVYLQYIKAWGPRFWLPVAVVIAYTVGQASKLTNDSWLAIWADKVTKNPDSDASSYYLMVYGLTGLAAMVLCCGRWFVLAIGMLNAARNLHTQLLEKCLRLPMSFFDSQPAGRLINRFARDTEKVDLTLADTIQGYLDCLFSAMFSLLLISYVTPVFIFPLILLLSMYKYIEIYYLNTSREVKRLDSLLRSPIFSHFGETIRGLVTIRAFRKQDEFVEMSYQRVNDSSRAFLASNSINRWLAVRLELIGACLVFGVACAAVLSHNPDAGFIGLALTSALTISSTMTWMVRMNAEVETSMNSVERVLEYTKLDAEAAPIVPGNRPPSDWPWKGSIEASDVWVRYRPELEPVLKGLTFAIKGAEKVGICGRTGCGKSTLTMALYRIVELSQGAIVIDGIDVSKIGLQDLRSKLALVPQDPVIFSGTIRMNLDPFHQARGDSDLWEALRKSGMAPVVSALPGKLDAEVAESGQNFSVGQRQLLCMGRALLRNARILVLDEATSNVDSTTDSVIQTTIREAFRHCTVLTIAHRLHTIIDSDRVLLLEKGKLMEFDSPARLLENDHSIFTSFVNKTLPKQAQALRRAAIAKAASSPRTG